MKLAKTASDHPAYTCAEHPPQNAACNMLLTRPAAAGRGVFGNDRRIAGSSQQDFVGLPFFDLHERRAAVGGADAELPGSVGVIGDVPKVVPDFPLELAHLAAARIGARRRADLVEWIAVV